MLHVIIMLELCEVEHVEPIYDVFVVKVPVHVHLVIFLFDRRRESVVAHRTVSRQPVGGATVLKALVDVPLELRRILRHAESLRTHRAFDDGRCGGSVSQCSPVVVDVPMTRRGFVSREKVGVWYCNTMSLLRRVCV